MDTSSINDDDNDTSWSKSLIDDLKKCHDGFYAATPDLISHADFFLGGSVGDITIVKNEGKKVLRAHQSTLRRLDFTTGKRVDRGRILRVAKQ